jgi:hypothetical protein
MKKLLIVFSLAFIFLGTGGWLIFQQYLEKEKEKSALELNKRQIELDKTKKSFDEQIKQAPDWKPLGSLSGDTAESILKGITNNYGFSRFIDTWGRGKALYIPSEAWNNLNDQQRNMLIDYSKKSGLNAIDIGRLKSSDNMYIDSTVWQN